MAIDINDPRRKTYMEMIKLARDNRWPGTPAIFGDYLILAICWEETTFMNIPQVKGPARGFGQLEPSAFRLIINKFEMNISVEEAQKLVETDTTSIQFVGRALHTLHDNLIANAKAKKSFVQNPFAATLNGYAGNYGEYKAAWREEAIQCWLKCEKMQSMARHVICQSEFVPNRTALSQALREGTPPNRRAPGPEWDKLMEKVLVGIPD